MPSWSAEHAERFLLMRFEEALSIHDRRAARFWELAIEYGAHLSATRFRVQLSALGADEGQVLTWAALIATSRLLNAQDHHGKAPLTVPEYQVDLRPYQRAMVDEVRRRADAGETVTIVSTVGAGRAC